jgi:hypothetical protein
MLAIHVLAMSDSDNQHRDALVLNVTNQPIVAHPVTPQSALVPVERLPLFTRVIRHLYPLSQKSDDRCLRGAV